MVIEQYQEAIACPNCHSAFNLACSKHYDIYFENINDTTENHDFDIEYNTDAEKIREIEDKGISGYTFTIINADKKNMYLLGKGTIEQKQLLDSNDLYKKITNYDNVKLYYYDEMMKKYVLVDSEIEI